MSESQPHQSGLGAPEQPHSLPQQDPQPWTPVDQSRVPEQYDPQGLQPTPQAGATGKTGFTSAEGFWYLLGNIALGAMYLRKVPAKKAMSEFGLAEMTGAEKTWYTILCILCGAGYFAKLPVAKAISEMPRFVASGRGLTPAGTFWYILGCLAYGANYFAKVCAKKALSDFGLSELNSTEETWYTILCIACGFGYFAKIPTAKAVSEMPQFSTTAQIPAAAHGN
jgi:hypothetical protein